MILCFILTHSNAIFLFFLASEESEYWPFHFTKIGRWWDGQNKIDIAAIDPDGNNIILGECKYWQEPVGITVLQDLESKTSGIEWRRNQRHVWYVLFSAGGITMPFCR